MNIPNIPKVVPPSINRSRYHLMAFINSGSVNRRADIAVMASIIIIIGDTIPALTAASPKISAPTMEIAEPPTFGIRHLVFAYHFLLEYRKIISLIVLQKKQERVQCFSEMQSLLIVLGVTFLD